MSRRAFLPSMLQMLVCTSVLSARQGDPDTRPMEFGIGFRLIEAPAGLLGDMTNVTPAWSSYFDFAKHITSDRVALRARMAYDTWGGHKFRGTDGHRASVDRIAATAGLVFFFGHKNNPDSTHYICLEGGASKWNVDSSYQPLRGPAYQKPVFGVQYGTVSEGVFLECGVEANFLDTGGIGFKDYNRLSVAVNVSLGYKLELTKK